MSALYTYALGGLAVAALLLAFVLWMQKVEADMALADLQLVHSQAAAEFEREARERERVWRAEVDRIAREYEERRKDVEAMQRKTLDDLRSGNATLRRLWRGCEARAGVPGDPAPAASADEAADDRSASASRIVGAAAECDAQVEGLQRYIERVIRQWPSEPQR